MHRFISEIFKLLNKIIKFDPEFILFNFRKFKILGEKEREHSLLYGDIVDCDFIKY